MSTTKKPPRDSGLPSRQANIAYECPQENGAVTYGRAVVVSYRRTGHQFGDDVDDLALNVDHIVTTSRYVVPTGRVKVPAGRSKVIPAGRTNISPGSIMLTPSC
ncbi:hypothetical protein Tco_0547744 [Tanacetum coccineum]